MYYVFYNNVRISDVIDPDAKLIRGFLEQNLFLLSCTLYIKPSPMPSYLAHIQNIEHFVGKQEKYTHLYLNDYFWLITKEFKLHS